MKLDYTMISVNVIAATLMSSYLIFYYFMTKKKVTLMISVFAFFEEFLGALQNICKIFREGGGLKPAMLV